MSPVERITAILERARIAGGWNDDDVALQVLRELGIEDTHNRTAHNDAHASGEYSHVNITEPRTPYVPAPPVIEPGTMGNEPVEQALRHTQTRQG